MKPILKANLIAALITAAATAIIETGALALFDVPDTAQPETQAKRPRSIILSNYTNDLATVKEVGNTNNLALRERIGKLEQELAQANCATNGWKSSYVEVAANIGEIRQLVQDDSERTSNSRRGRALRCIARLFSYGVDDWLRSSDRSLRILNAIDTSFMTAEEAEFHKKYRQLIDDKYACQNRYWLTRMNCILTDSDKDPIYREKEETQRDNQDKVEFALRDLREQERELLLKKTAEALNLSEDQTKDFVTTITGISDILGRAPALD